jgi:hypothetical protein
MSKTKMPIINDLPDIKGTGPSGAITAQDIARARNAARMASIPGAGRRPPVTPVPTPYPWGGRGPSFDIDLFDANPLVSLVRKLPAADGILGDPPTMFSAGDLPVITASGVDPELLRWVPWTHRHSAATTPDRSDAQQMIEEADQLVIDTRSLQNRRGRRSMGTLPVGCVALGHRADAT